MSDQRALLRRTAGERGGGTMWDGRAAIRIAVSGWMTTAADIDRTLAAFRAALVTA